MDVLSHYLATKQKLIDRVLDRCLPPATAEPRLIHECMRYSTLGGKRLRPIITLAVAEMIGCPAEKVLPTCAAIELIHTHTLILDDMPCMDSDDYRRGRPTCHKLYGEGLALLAADAVLNLAITILGANHCEANLPAETALEIIREVGESAGTNGVIGGQAADLAFADDGDISAGTLERIHLHKTARLFRLSARAGALVAGAGAEQLAAITSYADNMGLAFQLIDDVLDRSDVDRGKQRTQPSYAAAYGAEAAGARAAQATCVALAALSMFGGEAKVLRLLAKHNLTRRT